MLIATTFSETGAFSLAKLLTRKYGCTIIKNPEYDKNIGKWVFKYRDPVFNSVDDKIGRIPKGDYRAKK